MKKKDWIIILILAAILVYAFCLLSLILTEKETQDPSHCSNKTLIKNVQCLHQFVINNFKYKKTDDSLSLTTKALVERGGDCKDWTEFYKRNLEKNGFENFEEVIMPMKEFENETLGHMFLVAWDEESYCTMDMKDSECWEIEL